MADLSKLTNAYNTMPPPISGSSGTGTNLVQMAQQGKFATDTGISYPVSSLNKNVTANQNNPNYFKQMATDQIQKYLTQGQQYTVKAQQNSIYGVNRLPWVFAVFEDVQSQSLESAAASATTTTAKGSSTSTLANTFIKATSTQNALVWTANPKSVSWQVNQRGSEIKNKSGTILHIWRDRTRKSDYDDPKLTFQFQTGNIMPNSGASGQEPLGISSGLANFYQFLGLVDRSKLTKNGKANLVHILYRSNIFPSLILTGFFDPQAVVQFSDDSQNPFNVMGWQAGFTVYSTIPKINNPALLQAMFQNNGISAFNPPPSNPQTGVLTIPQQQK
jgi:predicted 3-demethylubiquinone-9 3-methyltransferase (glyoxalase superfamily)